MELVERVDAMGVSVSLLSAQWFLTLFVDVVPVATSCRIWDNLFFDGPGVIFAVALAAFRAHASRLLAVTMDLSDLEDLMAGLKDCLWALTVYGPEGAPAPIDTVSTRPLCQS